MKKYKVNVNGFSYEVEIEEVGHHGPQAAPAAPSAPAPAKAPTEAPAPKPTATNKAIAAPMQGKIIAMKVAPGDNVSPGQVVAVLEAMKMENDIVASDAGVVASVPVTAGQSVEAGDLLVTLG